MGEGAPAKPMTREERRAVLANVTKIRIKDAEQLSKEFDKLKWEDGKRLVCERIFSYSLLGTAGGAALATDDDLRGTLPTRDAQGRVSNERRLEFSDFANSAMQQLLQLAAEQARTDCLVLCRRPSTETRVFGVSFADDGQCNSCFIIFQTGYDKLEERTQQWRRWQDLDECEPPEGAPAGTEPRGVELLTMPLEEEEVLTDDEGDVDEGKRLNGADFWERKYGVMTLKDFIEGAGDFGPCWEDRLRPPGAQQEAIGSSKENLEEFLMCGVLRLESSEEEARLKEEKKGRKKEGAGGKPLAIEDRRRGGH